VSCWDTKIDIYIATGHSLNTKYKNLENLKIPIFFKCIKKLKIRICINSLLNKKYGAVVLQKFNAWWITLYITYKNSLGVQRQLLTFVTGCPCGGVSCAFVVLQQIPLVPHNEIGGVQQGHGHGFKVDRVASYTANDHTSNNSIIII